MPASVPEVLAAWMQPFAVSFTTAVWRHVLVLVITQGVGRRGWQEAERSARAPPLRGTL